MEIWKDVVGYEGVYQVSNRGRVKRMKAGDNTWPGRILKSWIGDRGYLRVNLCQGGRASRLYVHRLVAIAFLGPPPSPDHEVNHKNGNKADPRPENLEWVTHSENQQHAYDILGVKASTTSKLRGEANGNAKLTDRKVIKIRRLYATGKHTQRALAEMFGVARSLIGRIILGESWKHI